MLLRAVSYRAETLDSLVSRAVVGAQGSCRWPLPHHKTRPDALSMIKTRTTIGNKLGLHARASAKLTKLAGGFL